MSTDEVREKKAYEDYVAAYDAAQRLHARLVLEREEAEKREDIFAAHGEALHQIKEFARLAFMLGPGANEERFEQLWRQAFYVGGPEPKGGKK